MSPKGDMTSIHHFFDYDDPHGNIVFNFTGRPIEDLTAFALGYQQAAHSLAGRLAQSRGYADYEGYPVLFLYRHSLELYLKAIVYRGAMLLGLVAERRPDTRDLFERHELVRLLPAIRAIFKEMDGDFEGSGVASFADFEGFIRAMDSIDPRSYAFRYPMNRSGEAYLPHHFVVNVVAFAEKMDRLLQFLDGAVTGIQENWEVAAESAYELRQFLAESDTD